MSLFQKRKKKCISIGFEDGNAFNMFMHILEVQHSPGSWYNFRFGAWNCTNFCSPTPGWHFLTFHFLNGLPHKWCHYTADFVLNPCYFCLCVCRQMMTPSWVSIRVSSWRTLTMHGCAPMTCSGWPFTTLAKPPPHSGGQGRSWWRALCDEVWREGREELRMERRENAHPSLLLSHLRLFDKQANTGF